MVLTRPSGATRRILAFRKSATITLSALSTAIPSGPLKRALVPTPSTYPEVIIPASVVTKRLFGATELWADADRIAKSIPNPATISARPAAGRPE